MRIYKLTWIRTQPIYQNSNADLLVNLDSAEVDVLFYGNGNVRFTGVPDSLNVEGVGEGEVINYN